MSSTESTLRTHLPAAGRPPTAARATGLCVAAALLLAPGVATAAEASWDITIEGVFTEVDGHDRHVLTVTDGNGATQRNLETDSTVAYRANFERGGEHWTFGLDFSWATTSQELTQRAPGAAGSGVTFQVVDASFTSTDPGETLYFDRLEDTDVNAWTADFYATKLFAGSTESGFGARFGIRAADFDNDYHGASGIENVGGILVDASSNYSLMWGVIGGLTGHLERGRNAFEGSITQSIVFGEAELSNRRREYAGAFGSDPAFVSDQSFGKLEDETIPITDLRLRWSHGLGDHIGLGLGASVSAWWDVSVPPGIEVNGDSETLYENTIVFYGLSGLVEISF